MDCDSCPMPAREASLDADNRFAWHVYGRVVTRLSADLGIGGEVFRALTAGLEPDDVIDLAERLRLMYDVLSPPPKAET